MKRSNILQRTGIIGSNPIVAASGVEIFFEKFSEVESPQSGSTLDNTRLVCANVDKLIVVLKLFFVYPSRWVQRVKTKHFLRFDSGKRAVEAKLLKLVLFIVGGIGTISCRVWMHKVRVWRAHREVIRLFLSNGLP